jgi:hypothetical protein
MHLPGAGIIGFAGFASDAASAYEVRYGQYCAYRVLRDLGITIGHQNEMLVPAPFDYSQFSEGMKANIGKSILKRIREIIPSEYSTVLPFMEGFLESSVMRFVNDNIDEEGKRRSFEFRIQVPNDLGLLRGFALDGSISKKNGLEVTKLNGAMYLVAQLTYHPREKKWKGEHVNNEQKLFIDKMRLFENTPSVAIELPQLQDGHEAFLLPNPVFYIDARGHLGVSTYTEMKQGSWKLVDEIQALDETLWGKDSMYDTVNKMNKL